MIVNEMFKLILSSLFLNFIFNDIDKLKGIRTQLSKYLKKRKIEKIKDVILNLPYSETDRSKINKLNN